MDLGTPVQYVKGVGPQRALALHKLGIGTLEDLLYHLPFRYEDRRAFARIGELRPGSEGRGLRARSPSRACAARAASRSTRSASRTEAAGSRRSGSTSRT